MDNSFDIMEEFVDVNDLMSTNLPDPTLLEYYRGLRNREIVLNKEIDDCLVEVVMNIIKWNREDADIPIENRKPIKFFINSDGGDVDVTLLTANTIALSKTPVITIGMGRAYSGGGLLLMAGHKRLIFKSTFVLIHDGSTGVFGNTGKVMDNYEFTKELENRIKAFILSHTKIPSDLLDKNYRRDWFLFSDEIIEHGIADSIITDISEVL